MPWESPERENEDQENDADDLEEEEEEDDLLPPPSLVKRLKQIKVDRQWFVQTRISIMLLLLDDLHSNYIVPIICTETQAFQSKPPCQEDGTTREGKSTEAERKKPEA